MEDNLDNLDPQLIDLFEEAVSFHTQGLTSKAEVLYSKILTLDPFHKEALYNLSHIYFSKRDYERSVDLLNRCLRIDPKDARTINLIGLVLEAVGNSRSAEGCFKRAIQLEPKDYTFHYNLANLLSRQNRTEEAIKEYRKVIELNSSYRDAYIQLGNHLKLLKRHDEAIHAYEEALSLDPNQPDAYNNIGNVLKEMGRNEEAIEYIMKALSIDPNQAGYYFNLGLCLKELERFNQAIQSYRKVISLKWDYPEAHWNLALLLLLQGNFEEGWQEYEWRKRLSLYEPYIRHFSKPQWQGEDLSGKVILIHDEQGFGDAIQFVRYALMLKQRGARVIVECLSPLTRLMQGAMGVDEVVTRGFPLPEFDYYCSILSLPLRFKTTLKDIPKRVPYIEVDRDLQKKWHNAMRPFLKGRNVGIAWKGINPPHKSCSLYDLSPLFDFKEIAFFSLQKLQGEEELKELKAQHEVINLMERVEDFADTAAIMKSLDLIITVDTSIAHLAGALGLKVWVMLHRDADWRWLTDRQDSPWYPTMTLFRQQKVGDWTQVVSRLKERLSAFLLK